MTFDTAIFGPMAAHAFLVFGLYVLLMLRRRAVMTDKAAIVQYRDNGIEPRASALVNKNIANQFELPVLFYAACIVIYLLDADNIVTLSLAWGFVVTRYVHSYVHVTSNQLRYRAPAFALGLVFLLILWIWITVFLVLT